MSRRERSRGTRVSAMVALALIAFAFTQPWFSYDFSSGRQNAPDNPFGGDPGVETQRLDMFPFYTTGDTEPTDAAGVELAVLVLGVLVAVTLAALIAVLVAETRRGSDRIGRRASLGLLTIAIAALVGALVVSWVWLPATMEAEGVEGPFTYRLDEPDGYTRTALGLGWVAGAVSVAWIIAAGLWKFQAGSHDPAMVEAYRAA